MRESTSNSLQRLAGRVAVVTGAGRNIGAAIATRLAEDGARVVISDVAESGQEMAESLSRRGCEALYVRADVARSAEVDALMAATVERFGRLDILVNNAGVSADAWLVKMDDAQWQRVLETDLTGVFYCVRAAARHMLPRRSGRIVTIGSVVYLGNRGIINYASAKAGLLGLTRSAALELAEHGITVNCVAPGVVDTGLFHTVPEHVRQKYLERIPCHQLGEPADVANAVAFLVSDEARYIQGQVLHVCGGLSVGLT